MVKRAGNSCSPVRGSFLEVAMFEFVDAVFLVGDSRLGGGLEEHWSSRMFWKLLRSHKYYLSLRYIYVSAEQTRNTASHN